MKRFEKLFEKSFLSGFNPQFLIIWIGMINIPVVIDLIYFIFYGKFTPVRIGEIGMIIGFSATAVYLILLLISDKIQKISLKEDIHSIRNRIVFLLIFFISITAFSVWEFRFNSDYQKGLKEVEVFLKQDK